MAFVTQTNSAEVAHHMADSDMFLSLYLGGEDSPDINVMNIVVKDNWDNIIKNLDTNIQTRPTSLKIKFCDF